MKNVLVYTNPKKEFSEENKTLVKIQIDNSLDLGWKREDILLFTNFPYEYNGVESKVVPNIYCPFDYTSNKIFVIFFLLATETFDDVCWYHDFDAYQNEPFSNADFTGYDLLLTGYGYKPQCNGGSFFFKPKAIDLFDMWCWKIVHTHPRTRADEKAMTDMTIRGKELSEKRYRYINITYNFGMRHTEKNYAEALKPLQVLHFHPYYNDIHLPNSTKETFMYGKNPMGIPLMSSRLIKIFNKHGIK